MNTVNVVHIYKDYFPVLGGIENHVRLLAEAQAAQGHRVTVLVTSPTAQTEEMAMNGVQVIKAARLATVASTPLSVALPRALRRIHADIAHVHSPYPLGEVANYLLRPARRTVLTHHSDVVRQKGILRLYAPLLRRVLRGADRIVATSPRYIESSPFLRPVADRCAVIPLGIEVARFRHADAAQVDALRVQYPGQRLLFVGKLRYYKGLSYLIDAMRRLPTDEHLLIVGSGPMAGAWRRQTDESGLSGRVHFLGEVDEARLVACYHAADLFVLPASERSEAFGTVLIEAMAAGLPCISTELGTGTSYVNLHGETGLVVPPRDATALADAVGALLADGARRQTMARRAADRAALFSVEAMAEQTLALYRQLLSQA